MIHDISKNIKIKLVKYGMRYRNGSLLLMIKYLFYFSSFYGLIDHCFQKQLP